MYILYCSATEYQYWSVNPTGLSLPYGFPGGYQVLIAIELRRPKGFERPYPLPRFETAWVMVMLAHGSELSAAYQGSYPY